MDDDNYMESEFESLAARERTINNQMNSNRDAANHIFVTRLKHTVSEMITQDDEVWLQRTRNYHGILSYDERIFMHFFEITGFLRNQLGTYFQQMSNIDQDDLIVSIIEDAAQLIKYNTKLKINWSKVGF